MIARTRRVCLNLTVLAALGTLFLFPASVTPLTAQDSKKDAQLRTVHGVTMDKSETPVPSAVVFLRDTRTNVIRSHISDDQGNYRFSGLDPNTDYEVHAEKEGTQSQTRTVSSFDTKKDIILNLKLDKKKT